MFLQQYSFASVQVGPDWWWTQQTDEVLVKLPSFWCLNGWPLSPAICSQEKSVRARCPSDELACGSWVLILPNKQQFLYSSRFCTFCRLGGMSVKMNPDQLSMSFESCDTLALSVAKELGRRGRVSCWLEKPGLSHRYCHKHHHPKWTCKIKKCLGLGSTENRAWIGGLYLKGEVPRQWKLMKIEAWQGRLESHSVSLHWPLLYHKLRKTHSCSLSRCSHSATWDVSRQAVQRSCLKQSF